MNSNHLTEAELLPLLSNLIGDILDATKHSGSHRCMCQDEGAAWGVIADFLHENLSSGQIFMLAKTSSALNGMEVVKKDDVGRWRETEHKSEETRVRIPDKRQKCEELDEFLPKLVESLEKVVI